MMIIINSLRAGREGGQIVDVLEISTEFHGLSCVDDQNPSFTLVCIQIGGD